MNIEEYIGQTQTFESMPIIFDLNLPADQQKVESLFKAGNVKSVIDDFAEQLKELYAIQNPTLVYTKDFKNSFKDCLEKLSQKAPLWKQGKWVYYPWLYNIVHILDRENFQVVRTARNRYLIDPVEQKKFFEATIGIAGLSVGNSVALALAMQGGGGKIKLADFDSLALTNTNRIRVGVENLGLKKVEIAARQMYVINPYMDIELFPEGLNEQNIDKFFGNPKLDVVVDEIDNMAIKLLIRQYAKKYKIAVAMGADNGDNAIIDIERYDLDQNIEPFHNRLGAITFEQLSSLDKFGIGRTITQFLGPENITERMLYSLAEMGKSIVSWPQLGGAALLNGIAVAYCLRKIINKQPVINNRSLIVLDGLLDPEYNNPENTKRRNDRINEFKQKFNL